MPGLLFKARTQMATAAALRRKGYGVLAARRLAQTVDEDTIEMALAMAPAEVQESYGALGDGSFIEAIIAFFESPLGQQLIQLIIALLMGA